MTPTSMSCQCDTNFTGPHCANETHCELDCVHGGSPNADCTECTGCLVAWQGPTCNIYNASIDATTLLNLYTAFFDDLVQEQAAFEANVTATLNPIPGWNLTGAAIDLMPEYVNVNAR